MKSLFNRLILFLFFVIQVNGLYGQEIKLSVSPNPVSQGSKVRIALQADVSLLKVSVKNNYINQLVLKQVEPNLFSQTKIIPNSHPVGTFKAMVTIITLDDKIYEIPLEYTVVKNRPVPKASAEFGGTNTFNESEESKLNSQIDDLQDSVESLKQDKEQLNKKISDLKKEIEKLKKDKSNDDKLLQKQKELEELNEALRKQQESLANKNKELSDKLTNLVKKERDLELREFELNKQKEEIDALKLQLDSQSADLQQKEVLISEKEIEIRASKLGLDARTETLTAIEEDLNIFEQGLEEKAIELDEKETQLVEYETDLKNKNIELESLQKSLEQQNQTINETKVALQNEQKSLNEDFDKIEKEKEWVDLEKDSLKLLENELKQATAMFFELKKSDQQNLLKRREELRERNINLAKVEADMDKRLAEIEDKRIILEKKEGIIAQKEIEVENTKVYIENIKIELGRKYDEMVDLKDWLENKQAEIAYIYEATKTETNVSEQDFVEEFEKLESLSRLLQMKSERVMALNSKLRNRNIALKEELETISPPEYRYGLSPYVGTHIFNANQDLDTSFEAGLKFTSYLKNNWFIEGQFGFIPTYISSTGMPESFSIYGIRVNYELIDDSPLSFYINSGIAGGFSSLTSTGITIGSGLKYFHSHDHITRIDFQAGNEFAFNIGFEKKLEFESFSLVDDMDLEKVDIPSESPATENVDFIVNAPSERVQYLFNDSLTYSDMNKHWAKEAANLLKSVGIYEISGTKNFGPKEPVTKQEIARVLTTFANLEGALNQSVTKIKFSIIDLLRLPYEVEVVIKDKHNTPVRTLVGNKKFYPGEYFVEWNGKDKYGVYVNEGVYIIEANLSVDNQPVISKAYPITVRNLDKVTVFPEIDSLVDFEDVYESNGYLPFIQHAVKQDILPTEETATGIIFNPEKEVTRIEFILAASRLLSLLGASGKSLPDLSPYRDIRYLPAETKNLVGLYIDELGYGGDHRSRLLPKKVLTRAELAVISQRILKWQLEQPYLSFPQTIKEFTNNEEFVVQKKEEPKVEGSSPKGQ